MIKKDKVLIIITSYNAAQYWPDLLPALAAEKYPDFDLGVLVVDNNSSDESVSYIKNNFGSIKLIENKENIGFVGANNVGYQYARQTGVDYIVLLNQDTVITPGFLQPLYDFAQQREFGSLQSRLLLWPEKDKINTLGNAIHYLGFGYGLSSGQPNREDIKIQKINYASGACVFLSMKVLAKLPDLFDPSMFLYLEDLDLGWQLQLMGYDNYLIPSSIVYHKYSFNRSMKMYYWFERNRLWVMLKNYKIATLLLIFPAWLLMEVGQILFAFFQGRLLAKLKSYDWLFSSQLRQKMLTGRKFIQQHRLRTDRQVARYFCGKIEFQPLDSLALRISNIFFSAYWTIIKRLIFW